MNRCTTLTTTALMLFTCPAFAHVGPEAMDRHLFEHLLLALIIGLPTGYALLRVAAGAIKKDR